MSQLHRLANVSTDGEFYFTEITFLLMFMQHNAEQSLPASALSLIFPMLTTRVVR